MGMFFLASSLSPFFKHYLSGKVINKILKHKNTSPNIKLKNKNKLYEDVFLYLRILLTIFLHK
ncbi:hypothetical protein K502DRAFT_160889 [Neoconidiobolus thromboides FSU 785]|nr:hypothetical protein K502DRAFT_160889 [Neoconidiobolus thromboides FSU 785]